MTRLTARSSRPISHPVSGPAAAATLDLIDYLDLPSASCCGDVLHRVYGVHAPRAAANYAARIAALGIGSPQAIMALATVIPATRVTGQLTLPAGHDAVPPRISTAALREMLAVSEAALRPTIERILRSYDADAGSHVAPAGPPVLGLMRFEADRRIDPGCYLNPSFTQDWRSGMVSASADVACIVATRTLEAGLLLGPDVAFLGRSLDADTDEFPPGWVLFGPKRDLPEGSYRLDIDLELAKSEGVLLDIVSNHGLCKLAELDLRGSSRLNLGFKVGPEDRSVEIRLINMSGRAQSAKLGRLVIQRC